MRIVVSGADGFLGNHVLERMHDEDMSDVVGITLYPDDLRKRFKYWKGLTVVSADIGDMSACDALKDSDVYLGCAFPRVTGAEGMAEGLDFVYESLGLMLDLGCRSVINVSSQSVYNPFRSRPAKESDSVLLTSEYAVAKYCIELAVARICQDRGVPYCNVRMASLIGPGFDERFINKMIQSAIRTGVVSVADNGSRFGFLDVIDAADGIVKLATTAPDRWEPIINLGSSAAYSITEIGESVIDVLTTETSTEIGIAAEIGCGTKQNSALDATRLMALLQWAPQSMLETSVRRIVRYELSRENPKSARITNR